MCFSITEQGIRLVFILIPFVFAFIISLLFWLSAKAFLKELDLKAFKMAFISTMISLVLLAVMNIELSMGLLSGVLVLTVVSIVISMIALLSISFYKSFVVKNT